MSDLEGQPKAEYIGTMFARIVPRYDLMNLIMTFGLDHRWRKMSARIASVPDGGRALDVACGSGELTLALGRDGTPAQVVGVDFCPEMLVVAREKTELAGLDGQTAFAVGDALSLPFADDTFDAVTVGFALRNVADVEQALREMRRVAKPGGRVVSLELTRAEVLPARLLFGLYTHRIVPLIGRLVTGDAEAYAYLPRSVARFPPAHELAASMHSIGLRGVHYRLLGLGAVALHTGLK